MVREQHASGSITVYQWGGGLNGKLLSRSTGYLPVGCSSCLLSSDDLATADLNGSAAQTEWYEYSDPSWPEKVTAACRDSVVPSASTCATTTYDSVTGSVLSTETTGSTWNHQTSGWQTEVRRRELEHYGVNGILTTPAFNPADEVLPGVTLTYGGEWTSWINLPQPTGRLKLSLGPRYFDSQDPLAGVADKTEYVYYPVDTSVPKDLRGKLAAVRDPAGDVVFYDDYFNGRLIRTIDARGVVASDTYDARGRLVGQTLEGQPGCDTAADPLCDDDLTTQYRYQDGRLHTLITPLVGHRQVSKYWDAWGRALVSEQYAAGDLVAAQERREWLLNPHSGVVLEERYLSPDGSSGWTVNRVNERVFDEWGRLLRTVDPDTGVYDENGYDQSGSITSYQDRNHSSPNIQYEYNHLGRLLEVRQLESSSDDAGWVVTSYGYDDRGNLASVTDGNGNVTTYDVDDFGQTYRITSPVTEITKLTYNHAGQLLVKITARNITESHIYDAAGQTTEITWSKEAAIQRVVYGYSRGRKVSAETRDTNNVINVAESWSYNRTGQILSYQRSLPDIPGSSKTISYHYDEDGNLIEQSIDGHTVAYVPDHAGRPTEIWADSTPVAQGISYLAYGPVSQMIRGAVTETFEYDLSYRMTAQEAKVTETPESLIERGYSYDDAGNLLVIDDLLHPERSKTFGYDDLGRLRSQTMQPADIMSYSYDKIGNRLSRSHLENDGTLSTERYLYADGGKSPIIENVITQVAGYPEELRYVVHDEVGNLLKDEISQYAYDLRNKLVVHADGGGQPQISYRYDSTGLRVYSVAEEGQNQGWAVDTYLQPGGNPLLEVTKDDTSTVVNEKLYIFFGTRFLAVMNGGATWHIISDHIGHPNANLDDQGTMLWQADHKPFGITRELLEGSDTYDPLCRYPGQWKLDPSVFTAQTNLLYNGYRWYDPGWGRYTQSDPLLAPWRFRLACRPVFFMSLPMQRVTQCLMSMFSD